MGQATYEMLSKLLQYPKSDYHDWVRVAAAAIEAAPDKMKPLEPFVQFALEAKLAELEEFYTLTFDVQALCPLDIGYVLFGEDYKRGRLLVHLKQEHAAVDNIMGPELPDFLPYVLILLSKMKDREVASELAVQLVIPALQKMLQKFKEGGNVYRCVLALALQCLQDDYHVVPTCENHAREGASL